MGGDDKEDVHGDKGRGGDGGGVGWRIINRPLSPPVLE